MKLVGRNHMMPQHSVSECIRFFQNCGYEGIELSVLRSMGNAILSEIMEDYTIKQVMEVCAEKPGFAVSSLSCHNNYVTDDFVFEVQKKLLKTAKKYQTDIVIMSTFVPYELREGNEKELYAKLEERTRELCRVAEGEGTMIAIEVEPNQLFRNLAIFLDMAERINSPALKLNFDIGHLYLSEIDIAKAAQRSKDYIVHAHIENMCMGEHCHKLPWDGEIDLKAACKSLNDVGFDGYIALDLYLQDYAKVSAECVQYINNVVFEK